MLCRAKRLAISRDARRAWTWPAILAAVCAFALLAALIAGTILPRLAPSWEAQKFLFVTNLPLPDYYSGSPPPIPGYQW